MINFKITYSFLQSCMKVQVVNKKFIFDELGVWALAATRFVRTPQISAICSKTTWSYVLATCSGIDHLQLNQLFY